MKLTHPCDALAFKHNAGGFGTPRTLDSDAESSGGPISLHTAIGASKGISDGCFEAAQSHNPTQMFSKVFSFLRMPSAIIPLPRGASVEARTFPLERLRSFSQGHSFG